VILNRQRRVRVRVAELEKCLDAILRKLHVPPDALTICLVSDAQMTRWNRAYRGKNRATDVLSFPADVSSSRRIRGHARFLKSVSYLGDVAIAPAVARRNARRFGRAFLDEMRILILHGVLHLMGFDHEIDKGEMDRREQRLRRQLGLA